MARRQKNPDKVDRLVGLNSDALISCENRCLITEACLLCKLSFIVSTFPPPPPKKNLPVITDLGGTTVTVLVMRTGESDRETRAEGRGLRAETLIGLNSKAGFPGGMSDAGPWPRISYNEMNKIDKRTKFKIFNELPKERSPCPLLLGFCPLTCPPIFATKSQKKDCKGASPSHVVRNHLDHRGRPLRPNRFRTPFRGKVG